MAFLDKIAKQERTGAGIAGVNVDTGITNMINPKNFDGTPIKTIGTMSTYQLDVLDTIEKFAKDVDKARTENAKIKLGLDLENARLDLEEKWSGVHDRYTNDDTWNSYLEDKKKLLSEQSKMISSMKYMSMEEKKLAIEKNDIAYREDYAKNLGMRTDAVAKREADNARGNLEQIVTITSNLGIHDDKKAQENYKTMVNQINVLKEFAGLSNEQALVMYGNYVTKAEMGRQENYLEQVVMNEDLTFEQREAKLNELKKVMDNKDLMRAYAKEMTDLFTTDNKEEAEEYLYTKLTDESSKVINRMSNQFKRVKRERQEAERARQREIKARVRMENQQQKQAEYIMSLYTENALNERDALTLANIYAQKKGSKKFGMMDFLNNPVYIESVTDKSWDTFGDVNNTETLKVLTPSLIKSVKERMENLKANPNNTLKDYYAPIYEMADELSQGDKAQRINILKDYGLATNIDPSILINGENNERYYKVAQSMNKGAEVYNDLKDDINRDKFVKIRNNDKFRKLSAQFSSDRELGDEKALQYLTGEAVKNYGETNTRSNLISSLNNTLNKKIDMKISKNDVAIASEFTSKRKNYQYTKLKDKRQKTINNNNTKNTQTKTKSSVLNEAQNSAFGG